MIELEKKLVGKQIHSVEYGLDDWAVFFTDGSVLRIFTEMAMKLVSKSNENKVSNICCSDEHILIEFGKCSSVEISLNPNHLSGPEFFVFRDVDNSIIVEN